eukprot:scaffold97278_cov62-Attheya_sp.AAC.1
MAIAISPHTYSGMFRVQDLTESDLFAAMSIGTFHHYAYFNRGALPHPGKDFWANMVLAFNGNSNSSNRDSYYELDWNFGVALYMRKEFRPQNTHTNPSGCCTTHIQTSTTGT